MSDGRGLVHLHAAIRLDRATPAYRADELRPPDGRLTVELLEHAIRETGETVSAPLPDELGSRVLHPVPDHEVDALPVREHVRAYMRETFLEARHERPQAAPESACQSGSRRGDSNPRPLHYE